MNDAPWNWRDDGSLILRCHIQPGAKRSQIVGLHDSRIKIQLKAPPVDGKANKLLQRFLADLCHCATADISITQGQSNRRKTLCLSNVSELPDEIASLHD